MKRLAITLVLIIMSTFKVLASETYYSDYGEFSDFQEEKVNSSDTVNVIEERRYLWYREETILGDYKLYNNIDDFSDECYETSYSEYQDEKIESSISRYVDTRIKYDYKLSKNIRYINIYDVFGSYGSFRIPELIVEIDGTEIDYQYTCNGCWSNFDKYIHNGKYLENKSVIDNGGNLRIDLLKDYPIDKVKLTFYMFDIGSVEKVYNVSFESSNNIVYAKKEYRMNFQLDSHEDTIKVSYMVSDLNTVNNWLEDKITYSPIQSDNVYSVKETTEYRYKDKYCKVKNIINVYNDIYTKDATIDYIYKSEYYKDYYKYQTREKIELDIKEITDRNYNLNDFVISSSGNYKIEDNINISKNGTYNVKYILNNLEVSKDVIVNLKENSEHEEELKILKNQIEELTNDYNNLLTNSNKEINEYKEKIKNMEVLLEECQDNCEEEKECLNKLIDEKNELIIKYIDEINKLNNDINILSETLNKQNNELNIKEEETKELIDEINNIKKQINEEKMLNDSYQELINRYQEEIKLKEQEINNYQKDYNDLLKKQSLTEEEVISLKEELTNLSDKINVLQISLDKKIEMINILNNKNDEYQDRINKLIDEIDDIKEKSKELNLQIINEYEEKILLKNEENKTNIEKIQNLKELNEIYINKIQELENNTKLLNDNISNYTSAKEEMINSLKEEIISLKKELNENKIIKENKEQENESLNQKLNNYVLKINNQNKYTIIIIISLLLLSIVEKLKNKSNK